MPGPPPPAIVLTDRQHPILDTLARSSTAPHAQVQRAQLLLAAATGTRNAPLAQRLGLHRATVRLWRSRWHAAQPLLLRQEAADAAEPPLRALIVDLLADIPRCGAPPTFTAEHVVQIVAIACEDPLLSERPLSHWPLRDLAAEIVKRGIVDAISPRTVGRFLKSGRPQAAFEPLLAECPAPGSGRVCGASRDHL